MTDSIDRIAWRGKRIGGAMMMTALVQDPQVLTRLLSVQGDRDKLAAAIDEIVANPAGWSDDRTKAAAEES